MNLLQSLKISFRTIKKRPAFSAVIIFTLTIATGASIVVYSYMDALLFTTPSDPCLMVSRSFNREPFGYRRHGKNRLFEVYRYIVPYIPYDRKTFLVKGFDRVKTAT